MYSSKLLSVATIGRLDTLILYLDFNPRLIVPQLFVSQETIQICCLHKGICIRLAFHDHAPPSSIRFLHVFIDFVHHKFTDNSYQSSGLSGAGSIVAIVMSPSEPVRLAMRQHIHHSGRKELTNGKICQSVVCAGILIIDLVSMRV